MSKYVGDTSAAKSLSAYIVLNRRGENVATIRAHFGNSRVLVNVHDNKAGFQHATASGYGYDKFTAALSGLSVDGHKLTNHCGEALKPPRGLPCFPEGYKPRKGYSLANWGHWERLGSGKYARRHAYDWRDMARAELGESAPWENVAQRAREMEAQALDAGRLISGYASCHRESGLKYLSAIGYRVIQAI